MGEPSQVNRSVSEIGTLDTGSQDLPPLACSATRQGSKVSFWKGYARPYLVAVAMFFLAPLAVALATQPLDSVLYSSPQMPWTILQDMNMLFMTVVSFPLLVVMLLSEQQRHTPSPRQDCGRRHPVSQERQG